MSVLLFADDIVLVADSPQQLKKMLDEVTKHALQIRYTLSASKSAICIYGKSDEDESDDMFEWELSGAKVNVVKTYKYLGVDLDEKLSEKETRERLMHNANRSMSDTWSLMSRAYALPTQAVIDLWQQHIKMNLEYVPELMLRYEKWSEAESMQMEMARRVLGVKRCTANSAVRGELGWWKLRRRRDLARLKCWAKFVRMSSERITKRVYTKSRKETQIRAQEMKEQDKKKKREKREKSTERG